MPTPTASHVWPAGLADSGRRTQAARFTRRLTLAAAPGRAELRLFASTRYRLLVNGAFVASGPVRFVPGHERHDAHDLAPHLRAGDNAVVVEAWFVDARNFQSMPGDRGRFAAWGTVTAGGESHDLSTPGDWRAAACDAWRDDGPAYSFAIGPVEVLDVAALADAPDGDAPDVIGDVGVLADRPRGIPYPSFAVEPFACRSLRPIRPHGRRAGSSASTRPSTCARPRPPPSGRSSGTRHSCTARPRGAPTCSPTGGRTTSTARRSVATTTRRGATASGSASTCGRAGTCCAARRHSSRRPTRCCSSCRPTAG